MKLKLLVFHPVIAPYRIDFFNKLSEEFDARVCLFLHNLPDQTFDYEKILAQLYFKPIFLDQKIGPINKGIEQQLRDFDPDIVLVPEVGIITIQTLAFKKLHHKSFKVISMVDDSYDMMFGGNQFSKRHAMAEKLLFPHLDDLIVVDPKVKERLMEEYGKGILFPIIQKEERICSQYKDCSSEADRIVKEYGLQGCKVLLSVCRIVKLKNLESSIEAFKRTDNKSYRYVIVGSGPDEERLKTIAADDSRIIFTGRKEGKELYGWYLVAGAFILPSVQEAFGAVTDEALLGGCWCLVSQKAGSSSLIEEGINGNVFDPLDIESITPLIQSALDRSDSPSIPARIRDNRRIVSFNDCFRSMSERLTGSTKPRVMFIMHMPPPVHGAAVVGKMIHDSKLVNETFECRYLNLAVASNLTDIGKLSFKKILNVLKLIRQARRIANHFAPNLIYFTANTVGMPFYKDYIVKQSLRQKAKNIVLHFHNKGVATRQDRWFDNLLYKRFFKDVKVILLDQCLYEDVRKYISETDVRYCANGIEDMASDIPAKNGDGRILFLSNMMAAKGVWVLLEACHILKERKVHFACDFIGGWKDIQEESFLNKVKEYGLESMVKAYGPKYNEEKEKFLDSASFMVFPTLYECFGLVLLEAMQHGLACIASDEGAIPSIVKDGETGFIVPKNDPEALADAMEKLCKNSTLCKEMGEAGHKRFEEDFTKNKFEQNFCNVIKDLL